MQATQQISSNACLILQNNVEKQAQPVLKLIGNKQTIYLNIGPEQRQADSYMKKKIMLGR